MNATRLLDAVAPSRWIAPTSPPRSGGFVFLLTVGGLFLASAGVVAAAGPPAEWGPGTNAFLPEADDAPEPVGSALRSDAHHAGASGVPGAGRPAGTSLAPEWRSGVDRPVLVALAGFGVLALVAWVAWRWYRRRRSPLVIKTE